MFIFFNDFIMFDLLWMPIFVNFFLFFFFFISMKEPFNKLIQFNEVNYTKKKIKFFKKKFYDDYYNLIKFLYKFTIYIYILLFLNNCYFFSFTNISYYSNFHLYNYVWIYYVIINLIIIVLLIFLFSYFLNNLKKSFELLISITLFLNCLFYYLLSNNLIILIFIFEVQSLIFIYLLSTNFYLNINLNNFYTLKYNNFTIQPIWYFNSLLYQFWISFIGALLLIYSSLNFFKLISFNDWLNLEIYVYMYYHLFKYKSFLQIFFYFFPLILGFFLKLGSLPFFLWKPEIYKNFNLIILFIYMTIYTFSSIYFIIVFFNNYIFLLKNHIYLFVYIISIFSLFFLSLMIFSITEIRPFLAYTSIIHLIYILLGIFMKSVNSLSISYFYLFVYLYFILFFFNILFFFYNNNNMWYFTDLQYLLKNTIISTGFFVLFISMSGIPPFLGFFAKLSLISLLLLNEEYFLFFLILISSFFISYFYIQNYRFFGYNIKNINYNKNIYILKNNKNLYIFYYFLLFLNIFSFFFINDFFIFMTFISIN